MTIFVRFNNKIRMKGGLQHKFKSSLFLQAGALLVLTYLVVFVKLGAPHMRLWDESSFAVNAYEMMHNGKYFSAYMNGLPDLWNTKPPLMLWIQILFIKILGFNELAVRLPSAIAAAVSILALFLFMARRFSLLWAWMSSLILVTSFGFITFHTARGADADALLSCFLLFANIYFFRWLQEEKGRHLLLFFVFLTLAFATKSFAALLFGPAWGIILLQQKKFISCLFNRHFLAGLAVFVLTGAGLFVLRELDTPGFLRVVLFKDAGQLFREIEHHREPFLFYVDNFLLTRYTFWFVLLTIGLFMNLVARSGPEKSLLTVFSLLILGYLLVISLATTKLEWHDMPLYPLMAVVAAYPLYRLVQELIPPVAGRFRFIQPIALLCLFAYPFTMMVRHAQENKLNVYEKHAEASERYLAKRIQEGRDLNGIKSWHCGYIGSQLFYKYKLAERNQHMEIVDGGPFAPGDRVLLSSDSLKTELNKRYAYTQLDAYDNAALVRIERVLF